MSNCNPSTTHQPGKIVMANSDDSDGDGIPDFADGFDLDAANLYDDASSFDLFVPIVLELPLPIDLNVARLEFVYSASDPAKVTREGAPPVWKPADGALRIWTVNGTVKRDKRSVSASATGQYVAPNVSTPASTLGFLQAEDLRTKTLYVEGIQRSASAGSERILVRLDPDGPGPLGCVDLDAVRVTVCDVAVIPDYDRDGIINDADRRRAAASETFRFWINDDADVGDVAVDGSDVPGQSNGNCSDGVVNGRCDLLDFFPVWLDLKDILAALPPGNGVEYRLRSRGLKFVYTALTNGAAGSYLCEETGHCGMRLNQNAFEAATLPSGAAKHYSETVLSGTFLSAIRANGSRGVLMVEGASTSASLSLDVVRSASGSRIASERLLLSISGVKDMYRTVNLRGMRNPGVLAEPRNNPDASSNGKNLIFLHGYQPDLGNSGDMTAWLSEMFKRFHQSGSMAKFHGVLWYSNEGISLEYQRNVMNAFKTAPLLADYVGRLSGTKVVAAHSLGNIVVSSAIVDHNMSVSKYMLCDAAVASEAYDANQGRESNLVNPWWVGYDERTWAANWYQRFSGTDDSRRKLTWRDRFKEVVTKTEVCNFYSTGDEVFQLTEGCTLVSGLFAGVEFNFQWLLNSIPVIIPVPEMGNVSRHSWQKQEVMKGCVYFDGWASFAGTSWAGWGVQKRLRETSNGMTVFEPVYTAAEANAATDATLRDSPVFSRSPDWLVGANVLSSGQINDVLGMGIPALTPSTGRTAIGSFTQNDRPQFDLNIDPGNAAGFKPNGWPTEGHSKQDDGCWMHNDMKDVGYFYSYRLFDKIIEQGGLN